MNAKQVCVFLCLALLGSLISPLAANQPFWSMEPSTREIERADSLTGFNISKYVVNLQINDQTRYIQGSVTSFVDALQNLDGIDYELEGDSLQVDGVLVNGQPAVFTHQNGVIHIPLSASQGTFTTTVNYSGVPNRSPAPYNIGMIFTPNCIYTLSNPDAGRYWWPSYDHPWKKALVDWNITVREDWLVAANGIRTGITDNGNGTRTHHWSCNSNVATYVMGFAAGPYIEFLQQAGDLPIQNFVNPGQLANAQADFVNLPEMISFFSDTFGPYPFQKYGHMIVPMTTYAAMEHQTMTTYGAAYLTGDRQYESIVAHELAHQWYGNHVTPITMREVWLKESFATYSEFLWEAHHGGWQAGCDYLRDEIQQYYITWENNNGPHTIFNPEYNLMFAPPTYQKSASVLHMLRLKMGNAAFFQFIRSILTTYPGGNINTAEFISLAEQACGQDLSQFFLQWIYSPGIPNAELSVFASPAGTVRVRASSSSPTSTLFDLDIPLRIGGSAQPDSVLVRATPQGCVSYFTYSPQNDISTLEVDPNHWLLLRQYTVHSQQLAMCLPYDQAVDVSWNAWPGPDQLSGYHVYRRQLPSGEWERITDSPVQGLFYSDLNVVNGLTYEYRVSAVDAEGYLSLPSNTLQATPLDFPFDRGFLVVDETRDGNGANISPTDQMVDDFYAYVLGEFWHGNWDLASQGAPSLETLSHHPLVLWHCDDFTDMQLINNLNTLGSYVLSGGKLMISGWKYPSQFDTGFLTRFLPGIQPLLNNSAVFLSAQSPTWPHLHPDPAKLATPWNGMLPMSYVFSGGGQTLYTAQISGGGPNDGLPAAIRVDSNGSLVLLGFPLYFMLQDEVRAFLTQYLPVLHPLVAAADPLAPCLKPSLSSQPNPFRSSVKISCDPGKDAGPFSLRVFNLRGQMLRELPLAAKSGVQHLEWDGRDGQGKPLASGVYILELRGKNLRKTLKILRLE